MAKMIKLTYDNGEPVYVNTDRIVFVGRPLKCCSYVYVDHKEEGYLVVKETLEEIVAAINA